MSRVILVTGVSRFLGARVANALRTEPGVERVIGVDSVPPPKPLGLIEFERADIRDSNIAKLIASAKVDTVVHLNLVTADGDSRVPMKEINVIGTMQLLAACQRSPHLGKLVVRSSAAVYGSSARDPAMFTEDDEAVVRPRSGYPADVVEVEGYVRGLRRRRSDLTVSVLRFANFLGPGVDSPLTRYLRMPVLPTIFGFDPRVQFVHEDDGVEVLRRMAMEDHPGVFNVAGDGVLLLSQVIRRTGRPGVPLPAATLEALADVWNTLAGPSGYSPELLRWLTYGRVIDTSRVTAELDWQPRYTSEAALADFAHSQGFGRGLAVGLVDRLAKALGLTRKQSGR